MTLGVSVSIIWHDRHLISRFVRRPSIFEDYYDSGGRYSIKQTTLSAAILDVLHMCISFIHIDCKGWLIFEIERAN